MSDDRRRPPVNADEQAAWDAFAAAGLAGWLAWNRGNHGPCRQEAAEDAAGLADELLEQRRKRKRAC